MDALVKSNLSPSQGTPDNHLSEEPVGSQLNYLHPKCVALVQDPFFLD